MIYLNFEHSSLLFSSRNKGNVHDVFFVFLALYVFLFIYLGRYGYPAGEDYFFGKVIADNNFWESQKILFHGVNRVANSFILICIAGAGLENIYPILPFITVLFDMGVLYFLISVLTSLNTRKKIFITFLLQAIHFAFAVGLSEDFYWLSGMPYNWSLFLLILTIACLVRMFEKQNFRWLFPLFPLIFVNGTMLEQTSLVQSILLCSLFFYFMGARQSRNIRVVLCLLLIAVLAFFILLLSPGTSARMATATSGNLFRSLSIAFKFGFFTALKFFLNPVVYIALLFLPDVAFALNHRGKNSHCLRKWLIFLLVFLVAPFQQFIIGWALGSNYEPRGEYLILAMMAMAWMSLWLFFHHDEVFLEKIRSSSLYRWRILFLIGYLIFNGNFLALLHDLKIAPAYLTEQKGREVLVRQKKNRPVHELCPKSV